MVPSPIKFWLLLAALVVALVFSITFAVTLGPADISPFTVWQITVAKLTGATTEAWSKAELHIVWFIRLPRVLLSALVGAGLALAGVILQASVRNPMADPYILGIASGASSGAVLVLLFGLLAPLGQHALSVAAFTGGLVAFFLVFLLARRDGQLVPIRVILAGVAVSYFFSALTSFLVLTSKGQGAAQGVLFWLMGSMAGAKWQYLGLPAAVVLAGGLWLLTRAQALNILVLGDETAITLGIRPDRFRFALLSYAALLTGTLVAVSGSIGFVALMTPHIVRLFMGTDHSKVVPLSLVVGAIFLIWVDVLARTLMQPEELPITIITAFIGTPFFLWLMNRREQI
jgi:iron complex transport system permease protein